MEGGCSSLKLFSSAFGKGGKKRDVFNLLFFAKILPAAEAKTFPWNCRKVQKAAPPTGGERLPGKPPLLLYWLFQKPSKGALAQAWQVRNQRTRCPTGLQ